MARLNFHHLHCFWAVAREGHLTRAAAQLHVLQSALSAQIKRLEELLGQPMFTRQGRTLQLTEAARVALAYADTLFATGNEWGARLRDGQRHERQVLRIGAAASLPHNFQENFVKPRLLRTDVERVLQSGSVSALLARVAAAVALPAAAAVRDELLSGALQACAVVPDLFESFCAIPVQRHLESPLLKALLWRDEAEVLGAAGVA